MKQIYLLLFLLLILSPLAFAQKQDQKTIDSLQKELSNHRDDTNKVNLLNKLSRLYRVSQNFRNVNLQDGFKYSEQALVLATHLQWKKGAVTAYNTLGAYLVDEGKFAEGLKNYQAALAIATQIDNRQLMADCYNGIGGVNIYQGNYLEALKNFQIILKLGEELGSKKSISAAYCNIAIINTFQEDYFAALKNYYKALSLKKEMGDKEGISLVENNIGAVYSDLGNYPEALKYYFDALKLDVKINKVRDIARDYRNLEIIYELQGNYPEALKYNFTSLKLCEQINDQQGIAASYQHIASVYNEQGKSLEALKYDTAALKINLEIGDRRAVAQSYSQLGQTYTNTHDYPKALKALFASLGISESAGTPDGTGYSMVAHIYNEQKDYQKAEKYALQALKIGEKAGGPETIKNANEVLNSIYENTKQYQKALVCYKAYIAARDSIGNIQNAKRLVQLQDEYNFDTKEAAIKAAHDKQMAIAAITNRAKLRIWAIVGAAILIIISLSFFFYSKLKSDKFNLQLSRVRQEALNAQMNDHFIGNTMDSINHFIRNNNKEKASEYLILFSRLIRQVLESASERLIPLEDDMSILKGYIELEQLRFPDGKLKYKINIDETIDMENTFIPPRVFQVLAENAIKHGFKKSIGGCVIINIIRKDEYLECTVEDNGFGRRIKPVTTDKKRTSMGSSLAEKLIKTADRNFRNESFKIIDLLNENGVPAGTKVIFNLPLVSN